MRRKSRFKTALSATLEREVGMVIIRKSSYNKEKSILYDLKYKNEKDKREDKEEDKICSQTETALGANYGLAVDIGTTTVAVSLFSIDEKRQIGNITETNEQTKLGSDVMMRIMNSLRGMSEHMHDMIVSQVERMIYTLINENGCDGIKIAKMVVVGNTVMCHFFLNMDVSGMSGSPFKTAYKGSFECISGDIGFKEYKDINIYVVSGIAAHVGADAVAVLCETSLYDKDKIQMAVDIGTNAEIILNNRGTITACSAAAGPAFEGAGLKCGVRAADGAINKVKLNRANGNIILDVISTGDNIEEVAGICGSGIADIIAGLLNLGLLCNDGYMLNQKEAVLKGVNIEIANRINTSDDGNYFIILKSGEAGIRTPGEKDIVITQRDIRNIQLAKAAIQAGCETLLDIHGLNISDVDEIKIAGVFGKSINPKSAIFFGLYPNVDMDKLEFVGNAAGNGAAGVLLDEDFKKITEKYASKVKHIELAEQEKLRDKFIYAMELKTW